MCMFICVCVLFTIYLNTFTDAPKEVLAKLRICTEHFSEDMVKPYGPSRRLKDNAMPTLHLFQVNEGNSSNILDNLNIITPLDISGSLETSESVQSNSDFLPQPSDIYGEEHNYVQQVVNVEPVYMPNVHRLRDKLRRIQKQLYKKKRIIRKQRQQIKKEAHKTKWENLTEDLSGMQKTFIEMITANFSSLPQVCHRITDK